MGYEWSYIKLMCLAKLDMDDDEASTHGLIDRFPLYANEAMTQICSLKPKHAYVEIIVNEPNTVVDITEHVDDFISFGDDVDYVEKYELEGYFAEGARYKLLPACETSDEDFIYQGDSKLKFFEAGKYLISYDARWHTFAAGLIEDTEFINAPNDVLDCLPSYIVSQCFKIDDENKSAIFRNEFEVALSRLNDVNYKNTKTFKIGGGW